MYFLLANLNQPKLILPNATYFDVIKLVLSLTFDPKNVHKATRIRKASFTWKWSLRVEVLTAYTYNVAGAFLHHCLKLF